MLSAQVQRWHRSVLRKEYAAREMTNSNGLLVSAWRMRGVLKEMRGQTDGITFWNRFFHSSIRMSDIDNDICKELVGYRETTLEGNTKGICPVCRQPVVVIESCVDTLDIHYLMQRGEAKLCPGSGKQFREYLKPPNQ